MSARLFDTAAEALAERADCRRDALEDAALVAEWERTQAVERLQHARTFRHRMAVYTGEVA